MCEEDQQEQSTDDDHLKVESCAQYKRQAKLNFYPVNVEKFNLLINADAEAFEFCQRENYLEDECPYVYNIR